MFGEAHAQLQSLSTEGATRRELVNQVQAVMRLRAHADERLFALVAAIDDLGDGGTDGASVLRSAGHVSAGRARRAARTASQLRTMPNTRAELAAGLITDEHAHAAADAAERVEDPELADAALSGSARALPADLFRKQSRSWAGRHEPDDLSSSREQRQRDARSARWWTDGDGMFHLHLVGDPVSGTEITGVMRARVDELWRADGGRDGTPDAVRTIEQRRYDAVHGLLTEPASAGGTAGRHPKYQLTAVADLTRLRLDDPVGRAEIVGSATLPQSVLERLACDAEITPMLFGVRGEVLWQGRAVRTATRAQWKALIARDGGCTLCGAHPSMCEAHHLIPWEDHGPTDITNLALVCKRDHHELHDTHSILEQIDGVWPDAPQSRPDHLGRLTSPLLPRGAGRM